MSTLYFSEKDDLATAKTFADRLGKVIVVTLGNLDPSLFTEFSKYVVHWKNYEGNEEAAKSIMEFLKK